LNLHEQKNPECQTCRSESRAENSNGGICSVAKSILDGGEIRCVGSWARQKIFFLTQYLGIFGQGMKNSWEGNLHYVEICSGPGRCVTREDQAEIDGTPLAVLNHPVFAAFSSATFIDYSSTVVTALNSRIIALGSGAKAMTFQADYTIPRDIAAIVRSRAGKGLSLVLIDPTDCSVPFSTVTAIVKALDSADLIINVALGTDISRNIKPAILNTSSKSREKYIKFLGGDAFFNDDAVIQMAKHGQDDLLRNSFRSAYREQLETLGYKFFETERVKHFYDLLFASRHEKGVDFWRKAQKYKPNQQSTFDFA
jgi:three-Cys-motif partner protein